MLQESRPLNRLLHVGTASGGGPLAHVVEYLDMLSLVALWQSCRRLHDEARHAVARIAHVQPFAFDRPVSWSDSNAVIPSGAGSLHWQCGAWKPGCAGDGADSVMSIQDSAVPSVPDTFELILRHGRSSSIVLNLSKRMPHFKCMESDYLGWHKIDCIVATSRPRIGLKRLCINDPFHRFTSHLWVFAVAGLVRRGKLPDLECVNGAAVHDGAVCQWMCDVLSAVTLDKSPHCTQEHVDYGLVTSLAAFERELKTLADSPAGSRPHSLTQHYGSDKLCYVYGVANAGALVAFRALLDAVRGHTSKGHLTCIEYAMHYSYVGQLGPAYRTHAVQTGRADTDDALMCSMMRIAEHCPPRDEVDMLHLLTSHDASRLAERLCIVADSDVLLWNVLHLVLNMP